MKTPGIRTGLLLAILCTVTSMASAQGSSLLMARTGIDSAFETKPGIFMPGYYLDAKMYFPMPPSRIIDLGAGLSYTLLPTKGDDSLSLLEAGGLVSLHFPLSRRMDLRIDAIGGINAGVLNNVLSGAYDAGADTPWGISGFCEGNASIDWYLKPDFSLTVSAGYKYVWGLYNGLRAGIGASFCIPATLPGLRILAIKTTPVLPAFRNYYLENPAVRVDLENDERFAVQDLAIRVAAGPMNDEGEWVRVAALEPGATSSVYLPVRWSDRILGRQETSSEAIRLELRYTAAGTDRHMSQSDVCFVATHNSFIWQDAGTGSGETDGKLDRVLLADDGKAAIFVDPGDANLLSLVQDIQRASKDVLGFNALPVQMNSIFGVMGYLQSRSIHYQVDPNSVPYGSGQGGRIDYLRYPSETLRDGYGDCDDLGILTAALLEASGVRTAFITVPGHIFIAAETGLDAKQAEALFGPDDCLIRQDGSIWIPIEATLMDKGLESCRQTGYGEWNSSLPGNRSFYPLDRAWSEFKPSRTSWAVSQSSSRPDARLAPAVAAARKAMAAQAIGALRSREEARPGAGSEAQQGKIHSRLAFLEYCFGELDSAYLDIREAVRLNPTYSACFNAGLIASLLGLKDEAAVFLDQALAIKDSPQAHALLATLGGNGEGLSTAAVVASSGGGSDAVRSSEAGMAISWEAEE